MKNLIHLTEDRHVYHADKINDVIKCHIPNPNFTPDDAFDISSSIPSHYILTQSGIIYAIAYTSKVLWSARLSNIISPGDEEQKGEDVSIDKTWFHLWYDENSDSLVALSRSGNIVSINPFAFNEQQGDKYISSNNDDVGELIGKFDFGIACAAWSVDGEVLALVTYSFVPKNKNDDNIDESKEKEGDGKEAEIEILVPTLMTMNTQFEILAEDRLPQNIVTNNSEASTEETSTSEESNIHICWNQKHGNALVAISSYDLKDKLRKIRIYKGESLELISVSRTEDGSGKLIPNLTGGNITHGNHHVMAWAGSNTSNLLACIQRKGRRGRNVVFLEQNGLQHGGFKLDQRKDCEEVIGLEWNAQSDLVAITYIGTAKDDNSNEPINYGKVQLYHRCNYHWYLKYELRYKPGTIVASIVFDKVKGYDLSLILHKNYQSGNNFHEWRHHVFVWDVSSIAPRTGMATVVDGCNLNLTMFSKAIVPPPMYTARLTFDSSIIGVAHNPCSHGNMIEFVTHLSDGTVAFCGKERDGNQTLAKKRSVSKLIYLDKFHLSSLDLLPDEDESAIRQLVIIDAVDNENDNSTCITLAASATSYAAPKEKLLIIKMKVSLCEGENSYTTELHDFQDFPLEGKVLRIANWSDAYDPSYSSDVGCLLELTDGTLFQMRITSSTESIDIIPCESESLLLEPCPWISGLRNLSDGQQIVVGLSSRNRLYCGERQLCDASSSFCLSPKTGFLSYVTLGSRSQLRCLPLETLKNYDPFMGSDENLEILGEGYEPRNVERGSRLVSILPDQITAVLQLPRGNLEGLYPRALVLPRIMTSIQQDQYDLALDMMRRQKVDMNLIVDMNPSKFLYGEKGAETMVQQVQNMDHLNLFLASLQNVDITKWKYPIPKWLDNKSDIDGNNDPFDFASKVNKVCEKVRVSMIELESSGACDEGKYLLPILSTFAKQEPAKLEEALSLIKENAMKLPTIKGGKSILLTDKAQGSIQYLAFLADYELLFNTALGMYDFDLAKAVARNSQMDPKVYLPLIKRLKSLPEFKAKYEVDLKLSRFESALRNLFKSGTKAGKDDYEKPLVEQDHFIVCKDFIEKHKLHQLGLELFVTYPQWHRDIMVSMADNLLKEHKADLALSVYLAAKPIDYSGAKRAARTCGDWKSFFSCLEDNIDVSETGSAVAEEVLSGRGGLYNTKRERHTAAARILLDYCHDVPGAIETLTNAELWFEARRISYLHDKSYMKSIIDAAVAFCESCLPDFEDRIAHFNEANKRYIEVLFIRRQAKRNGEAPMLDDENDETGSLFSLATNASNASVRSTMSTSSVGSTSSLSSVISASGNSSFNVINNDNEYRHKSKFNRKSKKKKKRKTRREKMQTKPGSEDELKNLIGTLKFNTIGGEDFETIVETIRFLAQVNMFEFSQMLYESYQSLRIKIEEMKEERTKQINERTTEEEKLAKKEGQFYDRVVLDCEKEMNDLRCKDIPENIQRFFEFKIA